MRATWLEVDWHTGHVENTTKGTSIEGVPVHSALRDIVEAGGVEDMLRREGYLAPATEVLAASRSDHRMTHLHTEGRQ